MSSPGLLPTVHWVSSLVGLIIILLTLHRMEHITLCPKCVPTLVITLRITDSVITSTYQMRNVGASISALRNPVPRGPRGNPWRDAGGVSAEGMGHGGVLCLGDNVPRLRSTVPDSGPKHMNKNRTSDPDRATWHFS